VGKPEICYHIVGKRRYENDNELVAKLVLGHLKTVTQKSKGLVAKEYTKNGKADSKDVGYVGTGKVLLRKSPNTRTDHLSGWNSTSHRRIRQQKEE